MAKTATNRRRTRRKPPRRATCSPARQPRARRPRQGRARAARPSAGEAGYTAKHIEVLEGLEPVRRRPGMYIGGTDEKALHHLFAEVIDNAMDEALAGHATFIEVELDADGFVTVTDNGRGIPVDPHPKFPNKSALEVIMCTLHAGGKFDSEVYETSGGLHGVGVSVVNALSERMEVEVARGQQLYRMAFERGKPKGKLQDAGKAPNRRGTKVRFKPDPEIFGAKAQFNPERLFKMTRSKAYLFGGVEIRWSLRQGAARTASTTCRRRRPSISRRAEGLSRRDARRRDAGASRHLRRQVGKDRRARRARMGGRLRRRCRRLPLLLLQHHPDAGRRHPRVRACAPRCSRGLKDHAERTGQGKRAAADHQRRRDGRRRLHALGVHPRAGIPGPDQGPPRHRRGAAHRRAGDQGPVRPLARRQSDAGQQAARLRGRARRRAHPPPPGKGNLAQERGAQAAPARQARRLHQHRGAGLGNLHRRGRLAPAAPPSRRATAPRRRCCRCAARSSTSPPPARTSSRRTSSSPTWCRRSAAAPARTTATRICATTR